MPPEPPHRLPRPDWRLDHDTGRLRLHARRRGRPTAVMSSLTSRVASGSLWNFGGQWTVLIASLVATPFVIRLLGADAYGVLGLIGLLIGYAAVTELGMGGAATRFSAEPQARQDDMGEVSIVWTALLVLVAPTVLAALILGAAARPLVERFLQLPSALHDVSTAAIRVAALAFVARAVGSVLKAPQAVRLRLDLVTLIDEGASVLQICLVPIVMWWSGAGLIAAVWVLASVRLAATLAHAIVSWRLQPGLSRPRVRLSLVAPLVRFGAATSLMMFCGLAISSIERVLVVRLVSVAALAYYTVALTVARLLLILPAAMSQPLLPAFARLQVAGGAQPLQALYSRALRSLLLWNVPLGLLAAVAAQPFLTVWAGPDYGRESVVPLYILIVGSLVDGQTYVPRVLLGATGRPDLPARVQLFALVPYFLVAAALVWMWGAIGAAVAFSLRAVVEYLILCRFVRQTTGLSSSFLPTPALTYAGALTALALPIVLLTLTFNSAAVTVPGAAAALAAYTVLVWTKVLAPEEREWARGFLRNIRSWGQAILPD